MSFCTLRFIYETVNSNYNKMKKISVTALAKQLKYDRQKVVDRLVKDDLIYKSGNNWKLTELGKNKGGEEIHAINYKYLAWPDFFNPFSPNMDYHVKTEKIKVLTATKIGEKFGISSQRVNNILSEIGWQEKEIKGWELTRAGEKNKGIQKKHSSGRAYVTWNIDILDNEIFLRSITPNLEAFAEKENEQSVNEDESGKKSKYPNKTIRQKMDMWLDLKVSLSLTICFMTMGLLMRMNVFYLLRKMLNQIFIYLQEMAEKLFISNFGE